ncbi:phage portal protein family protein [Rhodovulum strictum]|uniref:DUF935 family protein n=1 Tax=Rhodovulum strictum TaxID=58314 RepID=A0A844BDT6_9RHOB|nr:DUF935 family protein [Rhodovulum strictum]MRH22664.1 DUF935 family protein [Rhodovulum strictum]
MSRRRRSASFAEPGRRNVPAESRTLIANARNDITIPFYSGVLQHADDTLIQRGGGKGLKIYDEIERDTHAWAMLQKRKKVLTAREWVVEPASDAPRDVEAAELVRGALKALPFDRVCEDLLDATLKGFAVSEIVWARQGSRILPERIVTHDQRRFAFDEQWRPRLLTWSNMREGIDLPERKFIVHRHGVKGNNPYGLGLGTRLFWPVLFKREGVAFWLHFAEKFAGPTVVGETPYGTMTEEQRKLLGTLRDIRTSSAVVVPVGTGVRFLEAARSGSVTYQDFLTYWDKQISICVTGETLTTDIGDTGSRAASETHADMLAMLVDGDGDLLSDTLREQLVTWIVDYNLPGAGVPSVWRVRPESEREKADTRRAQAEAASAATVALRQVLSLAASIEDDEAARAFLVASGVVPDLSEDEINALVAIRTTVTPPAAPTVPGDPAFSAPPKKKVPDHVCLAAGPGPAERVRDQLTEAVRPHFARRLAAIRQAIADAPDVEAAARSLLELGARWTPDALARPLGEAMELAMYEGRETVFRDLGGEVADNAIEVAPQAFREQIAFQRQKRPAPTKSWTDALRGVHDRKFVIAGATDMAMLEDFQEAILDYQRNGRSIAQFGEDFDRIAEKYGWAYRGERNWRIRTILETNVRTSFMAGRLAQLRDPDMVRLRPYWQYVHGDSRIPAEPRPQHLAWHGLVLRWDDPWWDTHFPPNDWLCSCGVRPLSERDLRKLGKTGPDTAPMDALVPVIDRATGQMVMKPTGIGAGWDYMPGDRWERGLVPSALIAEAGGLSAGRQLVQIDSPAPLDDLVAAARPFDAPLLDGDLDPDAMIAAFLEMFGAEPGRAVLHVDQAGGRMPVSDELFRDSRTGRLKVGKRDRGRFLLWLAETLLDPDEIWMGVVEKLDPDTGLVRDVVVDRRFIRTDGTHGLLVVFESGTRPWDAVTAYDTTDAKGRPSLGLWDRRRGGKLLWKRK